MLDDSEEKEREGKANEGNCKERRLCSGEIKWWFMRVMRERRVKGEGGRVGVQRMVRE